MFTKYLAMMCVFGAAIAAGAQRFEDRTHVSRVLGETRNYRLFLPADYATSSKRYPVIYYFHGHSDRYTLEAYDRGLDTVPHIASYVATHDVIVVAPDGYLARDYTAFYAGSPYDVRQNGGQVDFGEYFLELVQHIDGTLRTLTSRRNRATSGLSMGGFFSFYLSARYPDLVGSASAFNPGPEFYAGEAGRRSLWRPKDHVMNHEHTMVRLIRASGDYISQYHEETRTAYAAAPGVNFEFRQDEYHRHWATSIVETFDFHLRAFRNPMLDEKPAGWNHTSAFRDFDVHGYHVGAQITGAALIHLSHVSPGGFGIFTQQWAPDGPAANCKSLSLTTAPVYTPGEAYRTFDFSFARQKTEEHRLLADAEGRLRLSLDCGGHQIGVNGLGIERQDPVVLPLSERGIPRVASGEIVTLSIPVFNPRTEDRKSLAVELTSDYPAVEVLQGKAVVPVLIAGAVATAKMQVRFTAAEGDFERARLHFKISAEGLETKQDADVSIAPANIPAPMELVILDGRTASFSVFRQRGNQGGGEAVSRTVTEGNGNGDGVLNPGEQATIWVKVRQGLDPFDKNNWRRAKIYSSSPWLTEVADIQEEKQREWTGAQNRTSLIKLSEAVPPGATVSMILDCEGWSFRFTPDVRYGAEPLYQAFQIHNHQLFRWVWTRP